VLDFKSHAGRWLKTGPRLKGDTISDMVSGRRLSALFLLSLLAGFVMPDPEARQAPSSTRTRIDVSKLGPQVGQRVPDFALKDQNGKTWTRQSIMGPKGAMLVFVRSADW
jgi:hypothetical protein